MSEYEIERNVEFQIDRLDKRYMKGEMTEREYFQAIKLVDIWATRQHYARDGLVLAFSR